MVRYRPGVSDAEFEDRAPTARAGTRQSTDFGTFTSVIDALRSTAASSPTASSYSQRSRRWSDSLLITQVLARHTEGGAEERHPCSAYSA